MEILFVTREPEVCALMASFLETDSVHCTVRNDFLDFFLHLQQGELSYDLLVCDFCQFQHMLYNVCETVRKTQQVIPLIFYNDPYPDGTNRVVYWISQNEQLYRDHEFHHLAPILQTLNTVIENPTVHPYISLLQRPLPIAPFSDSCAERHASVDTLQFRLRNKIPPVIFSLFEYFYGNLSKELSIADISEQVFGAKVGHDSVYSYISRLKKYIRSDTAVQLDIIRSSSGRYQMIRAASGL